MSMAGLKAALLLCCGILSVSGMTREYFLRIEEITWNYAPSGMNVIQNRTLQEDEDAAVFLKRVPQRIGPAYTKAVYKQYSDATYSTVVPKPKWLGFLGPLLMAEEGDTVIVHLKNSALLRAYSIHPHGLNYSKSNEGALYPDGTGPEKKQDDAVAPGATVTYQWTLPESHSPTTQDGNCLTRFYHSHVSAPKDIYSGLVGPLIICKRESLSNSSPAVSAVYALLFMVSDENFSWYLDENIQTYITNPLRNLKEDKDFIESNKMHGINGYLYGNLPELSTCQGNKIHWHLIGLGNEVDMHSVHFHGQILTTLNRHTDTVSLFAGSTSTSEMVADNVGHWLLTCTVNDHLTGMQALFEIKKCFPNVHKPRPHGELRQYFIAAEEEVWDYAPTVPTDRLVILHSKFHRKIADKFVKRGPNRIGSRYKKVRYVEYIDDTFTTKKPRSPEEEHLGILGPVLRAQEKDTIRVVFKNKASQPYTIQPHGVQYEIDQDGTLYHNELEALVKPGMVHTYEWMVPVGAGPVAGEADCLTHLYYSAVDAVKDTNSGLVGPLLICRPGSLKKGVQKNYNKEFHLMATVFDENLSWYLDDNIRAYATDPNTVDKDDEDGFQNSNKMYAINGFVYGNLPVPTMCKGDKVTWHLSGLGSEKDIHSLYFQGNRFLYQQNRRDSIAVFPHISHTVTMEPDSMASATVNDYHRGMRANYSVTKCSLLQRQGEVMLHSKTYYIAAMEVDWDYSPNRTWEGEMFRGQESQYGAIESHHGGFIGSRYKKVVYRQFTNSKFTEQVAVTPDVEHLGIMGPMIHANVGDKVNIVFKNMAETRAYSIHAHGVKTDKPEVHKTNPAGKHEDHSQKQCPLVFQDMYSGLIGPLVICQIEEFALLFLVFDENESWYLDENIRTHIRNPPANLKNDENFKESNKMHAINGFVYGNVNGLNMEVGDKVYWYLMGMGNDVDIHGVHWHGHSLGGGPHRTDVYELFPATFQTVKMRPQFAGTWLLHCHVIDHIKAGMEALYTVKEKHLYISVSVTVIFYLFIYLFIYLFSINPVMNWKLIQRTKLLLIRN
uniref:ferroxidase n=1 Tax=Salarias fasciatus TaxID=181472 RepID=A0A672IVS9_SALFA